MPAVGDRRHGRPDRAERLHLAGGWLQEARTQRRLTAKELARRLDVAPQVVSNWETGRTAVSDEMAHHLSCALELPASLCAGACGCGCRTSRARCPRSRS